MNCEEYWGETAGQEPGEPWAAHLARCPACAARWAADGSVAEGLRALAADTKNVSAPARVEANLVRAYRQRYGQPVSPSLGIHRWWAAAAAVLLAAAALWTGVRQPRRVSPGAMPAVATAAAAEEDEAGFIPLPNAAGGLDDDDVDLVRVELPRSAVTALGAGPGDDSDAGTVEAEVLLGPDGMARAVRFLN